MMTLILANAILKTLHSVPLRTELCRSIQHAIPLSPTTTVSFEFFSLPNETLSRLGIDFHQL